MIDLDRLSEAVDALRQNRVRTLLTALSVAWGIFMLVILLGAGSGLQNAIWRDFKDDAVNSVFLYRGRTTRSYQGHNPGRRLRFTDHDFEALRARPEVHTPTGRVYANGNQITYKGESASFDVRAVHPPHQLIEGSKVVTGRFINELDLQHRRKVAAIGTQVAEVLFKQEDPLGKYIQIAGTPFKVVGLFTDEGAEGELEVVYLPITTAQQVFGRGIDIDQLMFTVGDATENEVEALIESLRADFAARHFFDPNDKGALRVRNSLEAYQRLSSLFSWVRSFVWVVGIGTLVAGVVAVSNIMMISVRERTREIGLRKALGATPRSIVSQVVIEATLLTSLSGYLGLVGGAGVLELLRRYLPKNNYIHAPELDLGAALIATVLLVVAGVVAGYAPARRAARTSPVEALRSE